MDVTVVGAGVVGLTCASALLDAGHDVTVAAERPWADVVSAVAGAVWFPYRVAPRDAAVRWGLRSLARFSELAVDPATGVDLRRGVVVDRTPEPDLWWTEGLDVRPARPDEVPAGTTGTVARLPVLDTPAYLEWLWRRVSGKAHVQVRRVERLTEVTGDVVVVAAGLGSPALVGGPPLTPVRGQVVRLANPGLTDWVVDDDHPEGMAYVIPRRGDVVCGGTDDEGATDTTPDPAVEAAILRRCRDLVPALRDAPVVSRGVGLRPAGDAVSLDRRTVDGRAVVTCFGHGGAGVTLSWGCAEDVVALVS